MIKAALAEAATDLAGFCVVLFGSQARGTARPRSDFDIGVLGPELMPLGAFSRIDERFEEIYAQLPDFARHLLQLHTALGGNP